MKHLITLILLTLFSLSSSEILESNSSVEQMNYQDTMLSIISDMDTPFEYTPNIHYSDFKQAKEDAIKKNRYIMIEVEADNCQPCNRLNNLLETNDNIKRMVNNHIEAVKINTNYESLPLGLSVMGTPTVFLLNAEDGKVMMRLIGNEAIEDLEASLKIFIDDDSSTVELAAL